MPAKAYPKDVLYTDGKQRAYPSTAQEVAFLLGGIGTGNLSLGARGDLRDFELFNQPAKGQRPPFAFFALRVAGPGQEGVARVLEGRINPPFTPSHGFSATDLAGIPRFADCSFTAEYPFAHLRFADPKVPVTVEEQAFTPFIPLNAEDSGIPCAIFRFTVSNPTAGALSVTLAGTLPNIVSRPAAPRAFGNDQWVRKNGATTRNSPRSGAGFTGLYYDDEALGKDDLFYADASFTLWEEEAQTTLLPLWPQRGWFDAGQMFFDALRKDGRFDRAAEPFKPNHTGVKVGSVGQTFELAPGQSKTLTFVYAWNVPNRVDGWGNAADCCSGSDCCGDTGCGCAVTRNHYTNRFADSWAVQEYVKANYDRLYGRSEAFRKALFDTTLPGYLLEAISANITVLRSTTCFWLQNGKFYGWEGCFGGAGCCEGNCTHVWNYQQTLAFLFPQLERDMRLTEFNQETPQSGAMNFRATSAFGTARDYQPYPAADGQLGTIIRLYRDWKLSGDDAFLRSVWENAKRALDFAFTYWDSDGDLVLDSQQHNTYDIEFYGPNSLTNTMFYGALKAAAEMAEYLGEQALAQRYEDAWKRGSARMEDLLYDGEYYVQRIEDVDQYVYQYGLGCLSDQVLGQELCHVAGLGHVLNPVHSKNAVEAVFRHNFATDLSEHYSVQRTYALNDEHGLLLCTWPKGGRPKLPFVYSDEVWTGIEYQVATHLVYEGFTDEALTLVKAVRDRHDGVRRNPFNEVECGNHYARSMASWGLLIALSGYTFDLARGCVDFAPRWQGYFTCFFSCAKGWGTFSLRGGKPAIRVLYGDLSGVAFTYRGQAIADVTARG